MVTTQTHLTKCLGSLCACEGCVGLSKVMLRWRLVLVVFMFREKTLMFIGLSSVYSLLMVAYRVGFNVRGLEIPL